MNFEFEMFCEQSDFSLKKSWKLNHLHDALQYCFESFADDFNKLMQPYYFMLKVGYLQDSMSHTESRPYLISLEITYMISKVYCILPRIFEV